MPLVHPGKVCCLVDFFFNKCWLEHLATLRSFLRADVDWVFELLSSLTVAVAVVGCLCPERRDGPGEGSDSAGELKVFFLAEKQHKN